jgi:hypothetical protein
VEADAFQPVAHLPHHQLLVERLLVGEAGGVDRLEAAQELPGLREVAIQGLLREVGDLVVPALVAEDRGELGAGREDVLPLLVE